MPHLVHIGKLTLGAGCPLFLIAGPCVIESERHAFRMAQRLAAAARELRVPYIFKASYDKANRTSLGSYRGPGLARGLEILARIKTKVGAPVLTDVHDPSQVAPAAEVCDVIDTPGVNALEGTISEDERITRDVLDGPGADLVVQIADARNLRRPRGGVP